MINPKFHKFSTYWNLDGRDNDYTLNGCKQVIEDCFSNQTFFISKNYKHKNTLENIFDYINGKLGNKQHQKETHR